MPSVPAMKTRPPAKAGADGSKATLGLYCHKSSTNAGTSLPVDAVRMLSAR